jgi:hypothetical protein
MSYFRACVVANDRLYVLGGQEGDFMAKPGSPIFKCSRRMEVCHKYNNVMILVLFSPIVINLTFFHGAAL